MFMMIGGDGREYGPATPEEMREWIRDNRANGQTQVRAEGTTEWRPLASFPEFADELGQGEAQAESDQADTATQWTDLLRDQAAFAPAMPREFRIGDCLGHGWLLLGRHFFLIVGACTLVWLILTASALATCIGGLVGIVMSGPLYGGLMLLYLRLIREEPASFGDLFAGFGPMFVPLMLIAIVTQVLSQLGLVFCLLPGLFLKIIWVFALPLAADRGLGFWPALELSRRTVMPQFLRVAGLLFIAFLPLLVFEVYSSVRIFSFLNEVLGPLENWKLEQLQARRTEIGNFLMTLGLEEQFVELLNLPFAFAALMMAYEALFGPRRPTSR